MHSDNDKWRMIDLFSGIGGFSLAATWCWGDKLEIISFCEIDPYCQKVLNKHWPDVPIVSDIKEMTVEKVMADSESGKNEQREREKLEMASMAREGINSTSRTCGQYEGRISIDLITGGFPCQPFSVVGKRKGKEDDRHLWPEMLRVIQEIKPRWVIGENVAGIVPMELDSVLSSLEGAGYETEAIIIPACAVDAPHRRDRVWIIANRSNDGRNSGGTLEQGRQNKMAKIRKTSQNKSVKQGRFGIIGSISQTLVNNDGQCFEKQFRWDKLEKAIRERASGRSDEGNNWCEWLPEPNVGRVAHGVPARVDRLKALGNAIVPQVAYEIMRRIKEIDAARRLAQEILC